jgi:hypothetical protein
MEFDGKNFNDVKNFLSDIGVQSTQNSNGQVIVSYNNKSQTLLKDDTVEIKDASVFILKPSYGGSKRVTIKEGAGITTSKAQIALKAFNETDDKKANSWKVFINGNDTGIIETNWEYANTYWAKVAVAKKASIELRKQ